PMTAPPRYPLRHRPAPVTRMTTTMRTMTSKTTMMMTTTSTTDGDREPSAHPKGLSARARILGWIMALVTGALLVSVFATYTVLSNRLDSRLDAELRHEVDEFRGFTSDAVNPYTGQPYTDVAEVLEVYLQR